MNFFRRKLKKSTFNIGNNNAFTGDMGQLIPFCCREVVPGDKIKGQATVFLRMAPQLAPIFGRCNLYTHFFYVPFRLLWDNFEKFYTGGEDYDKLDDSVKPYIRLTESKPGSLTDYLGYGVFDYGTAGGSDGYLQLDALYLRAYYKIWNDYYRNQNIQEPLNFPKTDGLDETVYNLQLRNWKKDYFTSSLPNTQKGPQVMLPLGDSAPVITTDGSVTSTIPLKYGRTDGGTFATGATNYAGFSVDGSATINGSSVGATPLTTVYPQNLEADLSQASGSSINDFRFANKLQQWMEKNARSGSRFIDTLLAHFGVRSSDARLQRAEYLGGGTTPVSFSEVIQTSAGTADSPQGNMSGHAFSMELSNIFNKYVEEPGVLMGIVSCVPDAMYQQGVSRRLTKTSRYEYLWPDFVGLGDQAIYNKEIYAKSSDPNGIFGYTGRYDEYRREADEIHGEFLTSMNYWTLARIFDNEPKLNNDFIKCVPSKRIFPNEDKTLPSLYFSSSTTLLVRRSLPAVAVPTL